MAGIIINSALEDEEMTWNEACKLFEEPELDNLQAVWQVVGMFVVQCAWVVKQ